MTQLVFQLIILCIPSILSYQLRLGPRINERQLQDIQNYMNTRKNPCEDFYNYACGHWKQHHKTEEYSEVTGLIDFKLNSAFIKLLEEYKPTADVNNFMNKIWIYYKSCTNVQTFNYKKYLEAVNPANDLEWPFLQQLNDENAKLKNKKFNWLLTVAKLRKYGLNNVFMEELVLLTNDEGDIMDFDVPKIENNNKLPELELLVVYLTKIGVSHLTAFKIAIEVLNFENSIFQLVNDLPETESIKGTLDQIEIDSPVIRWRNYIKILLDVNPTNNFQVNIRNSVYFKKLKRLINTTNKQTVCNYIMMKYLHYIIQDSTNSNSKIDCMVDLRSKMDLAMNFLYKIHFYDSKAAIYNENIKQLLEHLRAQFLLKLSQNNLRMNFKENEYLKNKLKKMELNIGNLPQNITIDFVNNFYKNIQLDINDYYGNHLALLKLRIVNIYADIGTTKHKPLHEFFTIVDSDTARSSTPFYLMYRNLIVVPYGILQPPMYHHNLHDVFKLSLIGFLLAHEMSHGFDVTGVTYDHQGHVREIGSNITENSKFKSSRKCMEREKTVNIDERMADLVGIRLAYDALFSSGLESGLNTQQPNFTNIPVQRLFFLNFAQFFCGDLTGIFEDHDSDNVRLHETLMNFKPFADAYNCQLGDAMHPEKKCRLW